MACKNIKHVASHLATTSYLCKDVADLCGLEFRAALDVLSLINAVCNDDFVQGRSVDPVYSLTTQYPVCYKRIDLRSPFFLQELRGACYRVGCVGEIIDEYRGTIRDISDEHHCRILTISNFGGAPLLDQN